MSLERRQFLQLMTAGGILCAGESESLFSAETAGPRPLLTFGVVADIQYRDVATTGARYYRESLERLRACVRQFNTLRPDFVIQLGDLIDGEFASYAAILSAYDQLTMPHYHVVGNHDLAVEADRKDQVLARLGLDKLGDKQGYYDFAHAGWRFIVLNGNDPPPPEPAPAAEPATGVAGVAQELNKQVAKKAQAWNGVIGPPQRAWLKRTLAQATAAGEKTIVFCHYPAPGPASLMLLDNAAIMSLLNEHPGVVAYFSGHHHPGDYVLVNGIHYLTFRGMVETKEPAYALVEVFADRLRVTGFGREPSRELKLRVGRDPAATTTP